MKLPQFPEPPRGIGRTPRVSIIVNNYNYGGFLPRAISSALEQRGPEIEVIVVDDGSTDSSREVIARFGDRVRPIYQQNQGQRGAFNAGFNAANGEIVMFLDADDELWTGTAAAVAEAFAAHPEAGRVVFRLEVVDASGRSTGAFVPRKDVALASGDLRHAALAYPDDLAWPPTTGNAFAAWALDRVMPLPVGEDRKGGDLFLHGLTPLLAPVVALDRVGGAYRLHDRNPQYAGRYRVADSQRLLRVAAQTHPAIARLARELGYEGPPPRSVTIAAHRLVSLRSNHSDHPIGGDRTIRALIAGVRASLGRDDLGVARRLLYVAWFLAVALAPRRAVQELAQAALQPLPNSRALRFARR